MKKVITHNYERELPDAHNLEAHDGPLGFIAHSRKWYEAVADGKCPVCGVMVAFEPYTIEEVIEVLDKPEPVKVEKPKRTAKKAPAKGKKMYVNPPIQVPMKCDNCLTREVIDVMPPFPRPVPRPRCNNCGLVLKVMRRIQLG